MRICHAPGYDEVAMGAILNLFTSLDAEDGEWLQGVLDQRFERPLHGQERIVGGQPVDELYRGQAVLYRPMENMLSRS